MIMIMIINIVVVQDLICFDINSKTLLKVDMAIHDDASQNSSR